MAKAKKSGVNTRFIELAGEVNTNMPNWIITKIENKSKDEIEIDSKDIRTIKEKKYDTQHGNIKNFEENSSQKVFNSKWQDLNDRQREYLRKYNYPSVLLTKFFSGKKDF